MYAKDSPLLDMEEERQEIIGNKISKMARELEDSEIVELIGYDHLIERVEEILESKYRSGELEL